jgi:hypothetical protein
MSKRTFVESRREMEEFLANGTLGYLGLCKEGRPYVVPINYAYHEGRIILHCAFTGLKLDHIRANDAVSLPLPSRPARFALTTVNPLVTLIATA